MNFPKKKSKRGGRVLLSSNQLVLLKDEENDYYKVIDGQQRLITILLILKLFNEIEFRRPKKIYNIEFETRDNSEIFIKKLSIDSSQNYTNIDFFYISQNYKLIYEWFNKKLNKSDDFIQKLYPIIFNNVKFIWYELDKSEDEIDVFTRLNIGKILLTNAELIKAILLSSFGREREN